MVDKKLEENIKKTQTFLEFWTKFDELYREAVSERTVSGPKTEIFISTRSLVNSRFEDFMDALGIGRTDRMIKCGFVYEILSLEDLDTMSDERLNKIRECWTDSYIYLYSVLNRLKKKKQRIEKFNRFFFITKRLITRGGRR